MSYYFDYLDEKLIFLSERKMQSSLELDLACEYKKLIPQFRHSIFYNQLQVNLDQFHYGRTMLSMGIMICTDGQNKKFCPDQAAQKISRAMRSKFFSQFTKVYQP